MRWQCRVAPSLGAGFAGTPESAWGVREWMGGYDMESPCIFFGLYGLPDFFHLWRHRGRKAILWAGTDIRHFVDGYWLDDKGEIRLPVVGMNTWINENCESYVENEVEQEMLWNFGIKAKVVPSFLGDIDDYEVSFEPNKKFYSSVSGDDWETYGWDRLDEIARQNPDCEFLLYGNTTPWKTQEDNVFPRGRVSQEQMDEETSKTQGAIRLTKFDGFSEILAKSILWGQHPVSPFIAYPHIDTEIKEHTEPNLEGRDYYRKNLNQYPWNSNL